MAKTKRPSRIKFIVVGLKESLFHPSTTSVISLKNAEEIQVQRIPAHHNR